MTNQTKPRRAVEVPVTSRIPYRVQLAALYLMALAVLAICWWVAR